MFQKIQGLKQQRANLVAEMRAVHDLITTEKRDLNGAEVEQIARIETDIAEQDAQIRALETQLSMERRLAGDTAKLADESKGKKENPFASEEYRTNFLNKMCGREYDKRALAVGDATKGANLVPVSFEAQLLAEIRLQSIMRQLCTVRPLNSTVEIPTLTGHTVATWGAENDAYTETDATFGKTSIGAYKVNAIVKVSDEILDDSSIDIEGFLSTDLGEAFGLAEDIALLAAARVNATKAPDTLLTKFTNTTSAAVGAIAFDDIIDLMHTVKVPYRSGAQFLTTDLAVKNIRKLKDAQGQYIWQNSTQVGAPDMIFGKAVNITEQFDFATTKAAMVYGDFKKIWIADRGQTAMQRLNELYAASGQVGFRASRRLDALLTITGAMAKLTLK
jgi:HK97 family phage major capsid protein